ncbi:ABC transporter substrate-binding protein [Microbacterium invictum]|uniref:Raffinose/stachyose/melibiose transport system substrate-binding protein n=1 Tax=Microbacterium invictum TaxID=515415 RepID=A0AA40SR78_9MICO|nr:MULTISPECIES: extracellular solute-binding protein [Microbacterium]MBB4140829.1 raffinose/stachyose/melibiose transport system substrate-binding protein [Microbacterium invictum]
MSVKTQRGLVTGVAAIALLGLALTGCSTSDEPEGSDGGDGAVVTLAANGPAIDAVVEAFNATDPGFTVERVDTPADSGAYRELIGTQLVGGTAPDVIQIPPGGGNAISARVAGAEGYYLDLADESWGADVPEAAREQLSTDDGLLVAVPMVFASIGGIYNQTAVDAAGLEIPDTWSGVLDFCADATAAGKVAYGLGLSDVWTSQLIPYALTSTLVYGANPDFVSEQAAGDASFVDSAWVQALDAYSEMSDAGCFNASPVGTPYAQVQDEIRAGNTLATVSISSETKSIKTGAPDDVELTYTPFPATDDPADLFLPTSVGPAYGVNAASEHSDEAKEFLAYLATPEAQILFADAFGDTAAMPGDLTQDSQVVEVASAFVTDGKITTFPDRLWPNPTVQPALFDGVQAMFNGQATTTDVLNNMDAAYAAQ